LADEKFLDINVYEKDCIRLNKLTGGIVEFIGILGGEPLLHPEIIDFIILSRKYFPVGRIVIVTNGILLEKQPESFWEICKNKNIEIIISVYPIKINHFTIKEKADRCGVKIIYWGDPLNMTKEWRKLKIDLSGKQNKKLSNRLCYASNTCFQLVNGKLYKCWRIAYAKYFNKSFNQSLDIEKEYGIDIFAAQSIKEILKKLEKVSQFCRYCNMTEPERGLEWKQSRKEITEWI
jgi:MoaA/NifB/PqqE/SkfB family radical SAM enzyme